MQFVNEESLIFFTPFGIIISSRLLQPQNACELIYFTELGIFTFLGPNKVLPSIIRPPKIPSLFSGIPIAPVAIPTVPFLIERSLLFSLIL